MPLELRLFFLFHLRFLVNLDGCVNRGNCTNFFDQVKKDGRDQSARYVVPCYYDFFTKSAVLNYNPEESIRFNFWLAIAVPFSLLLTSAMIMHFLVKTLEVTKERWMHNSKA